MTVTVESIVLPSGEVLSLDHYNPQGKELLLCIHGFNSSKKAENVVALATLLANRSYSVITYNLAGYGGRTGNPYDVLNHVCEVEYLAKQLYEKYEHIYLLGGSLGGIITFLAAQQLPQLAGAIFINGFFNRHPPKTKYRKLYWALLVSSWLRPKKYPYFRACKQQFSPTSILFPTLFIEGTHDEIISEKEASSVVKKMINTWTLQRLPITHNIKSPEEQELVAKTIDEWLHKKQPKEVDSVPIESYNMQ